MTDVGPGLSIIVFRDTSSFNIVPQNNSHSEVEWLLYVPSDSKFRMSLLPTYLICMFHKFLTKNISIISPTKFSF